MTRTCPTRAGFTLIEVVGALLIFSVGVLMVIQLSSALSKSLERSAVASLITAEGQELTDSLAALAYSSLTVGNASTNMTFRGVQYARSDTISQYSPLVKKVVVALAPTTTGAGPSFSTSFYLATTW